MIKFQNFHVSLLELDCFIDSNLNYTSNIIIVTSVLVFAIGITGIFFNRKLIISILLAIELTLLAINLLALTTSACFDDNTGVVFGLYILCIAAAESCIGLALIIINYRIRNNTNVDHITLLNG